MAADKIQILPAELRGAASKINTMAENYQDLYNELYRETDSMIANWDGKDNHAFINQINGFKDDFDKMKKHMESYAKFLIDSAKAYEDTQQRIAEEAKKLIN